MSDQGQWYFLQGDVQVGPVTQTAMEAMTRAGSISRDTMVWPGSGEWIPAESSILAPFLSPGRVPPPPPFVAAQPGPRSRLPQIGMLVGGILALGSVLVVFLNGGRTNVSEAMMGFIPGVLIYVASRAAAARR